MPITTSLAEKITFEEYLNELNDSIHSENSKQRLKLFLDGEPSRVFRNSISLELRRKQGTFFSSKKLAKTLFKMSEKYISNNSRIIDPTCGIGDLLLPFATKIAIGKNFVDIIKTWDNLIVAYDIDPILIKTTKIRLLLLSKLLDPRNNSASNLIYENSFRNIEVNSFKELKISLRPEDIIVFNPPFGSTLVTEENTWGNGRIQTAALFTIELLKKVLTGQNIFAVLPDVLRSGSRYDRWRDSIIKETDILQIKSFGRFDKNTDVDVFLVHLQKKKSNNVYNVKWTPTTRKEKINKYFDISVGPVVPFRLTGEGKNFIYINTKNALPWKGLKNLEKKIRFVGKSHKAPFVVVRRTSSPNDKNRAVPTLVNNPGNFVVENHLFVLSPKDGEVQTCKLLIRNLRNPKTNRWLNKYIRCRHLTKKSLLELPWWSNE